MKTAPTPFKVFSDKIRSPLDMIRALFDLTLRVEALEEASTQPADEGEEDAA